MTAMVIAELPVAVEGILYALRNWLGPKPAGAGLGLGLPLESQITCEWQCTPPVTGLQVAMFPAVASSCAVIVVCTAGSSAEHAEANNTDANTMVRDEKQREN